jgi:membrane-bound ClpP family serine protease
VAGLALQAFGGIFLFSGLAVPWLLIVFTVGLSLLYFQFVLLPALNKMQEEPSVLYDDTVVGAQGRVVTPLNPVGTVQVLGETWTATSDRPLKKGEDVVVVERQGLQLYVEAVKHKRASENSQ